MLILCTTLIVWQDPIMNWSPFAVYNPDLIHWPESWPLVSLSPSVEPFVVFGYVMFYFGPYFPAVGPAQTAGKVGPEAFVSRHPLICLGLITMAIGFVMDAFLENSGSTGACTSTPGDSVGLGVYRHDSIPADLGVVLGDLRDGPGGDPVLSRRHREVGGRKAGRESKDLSEPAGARHLPVMFAIINVSYFAYGAWFWAIKVSHRPTRSPAVALSEAKVYDPQGFYEKAGAQGPYSVGIWSTWASGEPNGRPHVDPPPPGQGACASKNG